MATVLLLAVFPICMLCAIFSDIVTMTISNKISLALVASFAILGVSLGLPLATIGIHVVVGIVALAITFGCFAAGWMGGGDAKLIAATALWFGPGIELLHYVLLGTLFGAVLTLFILGIRAILAPTTGITFLDRLLRRETGIPYGVALGAAAITIFAGGDLWQAAMTHIS